MVDVTLPLIFRASRRKMLSLVGGSLAFVALRFVLLDKRPLLAIAAIAFFGLCAAVGAVSLHPRASYLELTQQGFAFASLFRRTFVRWHDVQGFIPIRIQINSLVGWNYAPGYPGGTKMRKASTALAGVEAALPDTYGMSAQELASLLNGLWLNYRVEP